MTAPMTPNLDQERVERAAEAVYREFENRPKVARLQMNGVMADELARAAITAYLGDMDTSGWQDIATAPKDGRRLLVARFVTGKDSIVAIDRWRKPEDCAGYTGFGHFNMTYWPPTHWQPIPVAPATPTVNGKGE